jgi:23S rRNA (uracil1939-C5)-methyltransferase
MGCQDSVCSTCNLQSGSLQLTIEKLVYGGDGLARLPADEHGRGKTVFVPFVLEEETVDAQITEEKRSFARGRAEEIVQASPHRVKPACPYFGHCGGCQYQHASYVHQLEIKAEILKENLRRIGKIELETDLQIHASPPWNYRNRTRLKIRYVPSFELGYFKFESHELQPVEQCPISSPLINRAIGQLLDLGRSGRIAQEVIEVELFADSADEKLLVELYCDKDANRAAARQCAEEMKSALAEAAGVVVFKSASSAHSFVEPKFVVAAGENKLAYKTARHEYQVSAGAFFQVNRFLIDELIRIVTDGQRGGSALDLYAGVGLFSAALADSFTQIIAVEASPISAADLAYNSPANVEVVRATTEQFLLRRKSLKVDLVILDPPRAGLGEDVVGEFRKLKPERLVYVSCDPATCSRDLVGLLKAGYRIEQAHLIDLFPQTFHLESVFHLVR